MDQFGVACLKTLNHQPSLKSTSRNWKTGITSLGSQSNMRQWIPSGDKETKITPLKTNECPLKINGWLVQMYFLLKGCPFLGERVYVHSKKVGGKHHPFPPRFFSSLHTFNPFPFFGGSSQDLVQWLICPWLVFVP